MRQKLGQHFLTNEAILRQIASILDIKKGDDVIEIGPGHGELTSKILALAKEQGRIDLTLLERDPELSEDISLLKDISVIQGDALKTLPELVKDKKDYKLAGNIPYYLTGLLLRLIGELPNKPQLVVFTMQKEVAERIIARPPEMNRLAASIQFWGEPEIVCLISKKEFNPPPEVDSATIRIRLKDPQPSSAEFSRFDRAISSIYKQPRKTIANNLADTLGLTKKEIEEKLSSLGISPSSRPQDLDLDQIVLLGSKIK